MKKLIVLLSVLLTVVSMAFTFTPVCINPEGHHSPGTYKVRITGEPGNYQAVHVGNGTVVSFTIPESGEVKKNFPMSGDWVVYFVDLSYPGGGSPTMGVFTIPLNMSECTFPHMSDIIEVEEQALAGKTLETAGWVLYLIDAPEH